jgi:hypothetical protein
MLPFDEVVGELGRIAERERGLQIVPIDAIVGTVDRGKEFDRSFRPTSSQVRGRWERIAKAMRRGEALPPVKLYRIGEVYFVRDGHHRVSVARALGRREIDGYVIEVATRVGAERGVHLSDPERYGDLAEGVEAWGFRASQDREELLDRPTAARAWYREEFAPVTAMLREARLVGRRETDADAYVRLAGLRYRLMRTMDWDEDVIERLRGEA